MTNEEIIRGLTKMLNDTIKANECGLSNNDFKDDIELLKSTLSLIEKKEKEIDTVLSLIKEQQEKMDKKDKQIDLMAEFIATLDIEEDICANIENDNCDKMAFGECENCIKQYFADLVEKE